MTNEELEELYESLGEENLDAFLMLVDEKEANYAYRRASAYIDGMSKEDTETCLAFFQEAVQPFITYDTDNPVSHLILMMISKIHGPLRF